MEEARFFVILINNSKLSDAFKVYHKYMSYGYFKSVYYVLCLSINYLKKINEFNFLFLNTFNSLFFSELVRKKKIYFKLFWQYASKVFGETNVPLIGGIFIIFLLPLFNSSNFLLYFFILHIFNWFLSDIKSISSPIIRLFIQALVTIIFVYFYEIQVVSTKIIFLDYLLSNYYFSLIFTTFCLIVLMNGSNFIDGLNGLVIGYFLIILLILLKVGLLNEINLNNSRFYF